MMYDAPLTASTVRPCIRRAFARRQYPFPLRCCASAALHAFSAAIQLGAYRRQFRFQFQNELRGLREREKRNEDEATNFLSFRCAAAMLSW